MTYLIAFICLFAFISFPHAHAEVYCVQPGDTLSEIAQRYNTKRIYGPNGALLDLKKVNTEIKDVNLIYKNQAIFLKPINRSCFQDEQKESTTRVFEVDPNLQKAIPLPQEVRKIKVRTRYHKAFLGTSSRNYGFSSKTGSSSVNLSSQISPVLEFRTCHKDQICFFGHLTSLNLSAPSGAELDNANLLITKYGLSGLLFFKPWGKSKVYAGLEETPMLYVVSTTVVKLEKPSLGFITLDYEAPSWKNFAPRAEFTYRSSGSSNNTRVDSSYGAGLEVAKRFAIWPNWTVIGRIESYQQSSDEFKVSAQVLNLKLGYRWF